MALKRISEEVDPSEIIDPVEGKRLVTISFDAYVDYGESDEEIEDNIVEGLRSVGYEVDTIVNISGDFHDVDHDTEIVTEDSDDSEWEEIDSKSVLDSDGFMTDYTLYFNGTTYIAMFGDKEIYEPDIEYADFESDSESEAREWFDSYEGFTDEDEYDESIEVSESDIVTEELDPSEFSDEELSNIYGGDRSRCPECGSSDYHDGRCYKCDPITDDEIEEV